MIELKSNTYSSLKDNSEYNRLIIVGNGFDLALGLKTGYPDFLLYYLKKTAETHFFGTPDGSELFNFGPKFLRSKGANGHLYENIQNFDQVTSVIEFMKNYLDYRPTDFLNDIVTEFTDKRWVDIEQIYYKTLKSFTNSDNLNVVQSINKLMDNLSKRLAEYIADQEKLFSNDIFENLYNFAYTLTSANHPDLSRFIRSCDPTSKPKDILFLNFNYTTTVSKFCRSLHSIGVNEKVKNISIHGSVSDHFNPVIFGYGDDTGGEYKLLEDLGDNEILRMIKSFHYPQTTNYHHLLNFLESGNFDVFVVGHSCGLSDRTLLKTIFEHPRCVAIRLFHYNGKDEHFYKSIEVSRHFSNKEMMRERLLPYHELSSIPQIN